MTARDGTPDRSLVKCRPSIQNCSAELAGCALTWPLSMSTFSHMPAAWSAVGDTKKAPIPIEPVSLSSWRRSISSSASDGS